jgi:hypothetical protein
VAKRENQPIRNFLDARQPTTVASIVTEKRKSFYELYPLPFFDRETRNTWAVHPSGDYTADCETGRKYARAFLQSCDGTVGWSCLFRAILKGMVKAGPAGVWPDGDIKLDGTAVGFLGVVGTVLTIGAGGIRMTDPDIIA